MTERGRNDEEFAGMEERFRGYAVYDRDRGRIGGVDDLFVDEDDRPEYIGVGTGLPGGQSVLIPFSIVRVDDGQRAVEVPAERAFVEGGPAFTDPVEITPEFERRVLAHYGLEAAPGVAGAGYGDYYPGERRGPLGDREDDRAGSISTGPETAGTVGPGMSMGDTETGRFEEHGRNVEGLGQPGGDLEDEDEIRVQRSEEELRAGTREREAGALRVRKRVRVDHEVIEVPVRHEEVTVERVPVSGGATEAQIGDDELVVPVTEEEVVVEKRPVAKEEVRIRKDVVEGTEVVEEDVRREEIDVEDATKRGRRGV